MNMMCVCDENAGDNPECLVHRRTCEFCNQRSFTPGYLYPAMCEQHYELAILICRLERQGVKASYQNLARALWMDGLGEDGPKVSIRVDDLDRLLVQMRGAVVYKCT